MKDFNFKAYTIKVKYTLIKQGIDTNTVCYKCKKIAR